VSLWSIFEKSYIDNKKPTCMRCSLVAYGSYRTKKIEPIILCQPHFEERKRILEDLKSDNLDDIDMGWGGR
jgi:hypothetical protein